jgi:hypothetical protein
MTQVNYERVFDKSLPLSSTISLTVTEVPDSAEDLLKLLERAMVGGFHKQARLKEIHLPMARFPDMASKFWHVPVEDCGNSHVLRLFFETSQDAAH